MKYSVFFATSCNWSKVTCPFSLNCSPRASQQGLEGGAVSQLQQFDQWQLELGCQWPISALHTVPTSFQRHQQELPALVPGWWCQWGYYRERALHVWGPHTSEAKGKGGWHSCLAARSRVKVQHLVSYYIMGNFKAQIESVVSLWFCFYRLGNIYLFHISLFYISISISLNM